MTKETKIEVAVTTLASFIFIAFFTHIFGYGIVTAVVVGVLGTAVSVFGGVFLASRFGTDSTKDRTSC